MTEFREVARTERTLEDKVNQFTVHFADHWLLWVNVISGLFIALPFVAPILEALGYERVAHVIFSAYRVTCHQLPERSYFIFGHQVALCHRCTAIWSSFFIGGVLYRFVRHRLQPMPFHWWILALIPAGVDGGTQLVGPLYEVLPPWILTGFAIVVWLSLTAIMYTQGVKQWQYYLFVLMFPLSMMYVHLTGTRFSNWELRSITGSIWGLANVWLIFPMFEESFADVKEEMSRRLGRGE